MQYVLHVGVGDTFSIDTGGERPLVLRFVGALRDSVLQGELVMSEDAVRPALPAAAGLSAVPRRRALRRDRSTTRRPLAGARRARAAAVRRRRDGDVGAAGGVPSGREHLPVDVPGARRARAAARDVGLATVMFRNVLERRRELALLRAVGYDTRRMTLDDRRRGGVPAGCRHDRGHRLRRDRHRAGLARPRRERCPARGLVLLLAAVVVAGLVSSAIATRAALGGRILEALRAE